MATNEQIGVESKRTNAGVSRWIRRAGLVAIAGGVLYTLPWGLEDTSPALSDGGSLYWLVGVIGLMAAALLAIGLWGVHAHYGARYGRVGRALASLMGLTIGGMMVGNTLNLVTPTLADPNQPASATLGGTIWGLAMFATLILGIGYGVVLWRAGVSRLGAGLLIAALPLFFGGLIALSMLAEVIGVNLGWLAFGGPFGAAWVVLGYRLWTDGLETVPTTKPAGTAE